MKRQLNTTAGTLVVEETEDGLVHARGVHYGTAKRFAAPELVSSWSGVVDATRRGPACPQLPSRLDDVTGLVVAGLDFSEDCLVLSVTAPAGAEGLPVMVWFHGGAYVSGSGESPKYDPDALVTEGRVVVVNVSYRLGIFGYLTPEQAGDESNLGLRDQITALRWVRQNISAFGGDPENVTVFGQSAGGDSVQSLLLSEDTDGLFRRAIMQSAPVGLREGREKMTAAMRKAVTEALDTNPHDAEVDQLLAVQTAAATAAGRFGLPGGMPFSPILGRAPLPTAAQVTDRIAQVAPRVELLIGYTKNDGSPFVAMNKRAAALGRLPLGGRAAISALNHQATKRVFADPAQALARTWNSSGGKAATYRFDWAPENAPLGAAHCIELPLLFGTPAAWSDAPMLADQQADPKLAVEVRRCWTGFAHRGIDALPSRSLLFGNA